VLTVLDGFWRGLLKIQLSTRKESMPHEANMDYVNIGVSRKSFYGFLGNHIGPWTHLTLKSTKVILLKSRQS
jgi:hypothetical protein